MKLKLGKNSRFVVLAAALGLGMAQTALAALVVNGGFETYDFTGWTVTPASSGSDLGIWPFAHSGSYSARFGALDVYNDTITQTLATAPGSTYTFSFWLYNSGQSYFTASWNGASVLDIDPDVRAFGWTQFSYNETATSSATDIAFAGRNEPSWMYLDDVSVVPEPTTMVAGLGALGLVFMTLGARRRRSNVASIGK